MSIQQGQLVMMLKLCISTSLKAMLVGSPINFPLINYVVGHVPLSWFYLLMIYKHGMLVLYEPFELIPEL